MANKSETNAMGVNEAAVPYPGSHQIPQWKLGELPEAPLFTWRNWVAMIGPGFLMGALAIGGGEWLMGPIITAKFGAGLLWLALLALLCQLIYNIEISRYTLYSGEPIFTGKFRTLPGPLFWVWLYVLLDFGMFFPYLAASAATPFVALVRGELPDPEQDETLLRMVSISVFLISMIPLILGGKIYNILKWLAGFKLFVVMATLLLIAVLYSTPATWIEICSGFFKFGNVPVLQAEDRNGNGVLDQGEDWDGDGHLDSVESDVDQNGKLDPAEDLDGDGTRDGYSTDNIFAAWWQGRSVAIDTSMVALLCALVAISGGGGLGNTPISNYTRDQGWGMGAHVGAIPSLIGGRSIQLSHVGTVFQVNDQSLPLWKRWYHHVRREQVFVWFPACVFGVALPAMLSVQFLPRGFEVENQWLSSVMTANAIRDYAGPGWGSLFWFLIVLCGFLVMAVSIGPATDGFLRRWVDVFWTSSSWLRRLEPQNIRYVYFAVLLAYAALSVFMLMIGKPTQLLLIAALFMNFAFAISCWHTLVVNLVLLPAELRPRWFARTAMFLAGLFYFAVATTSTWITVQKEFLGGG